MKTKRFAALFLAAAMLCASCFTVYGCTKKDPDKIRVSEVTHSIFYGPLYIALNNGYFKDEGLTVTIDNAGGSEKAMTAVISGNAEIGLMGPETVVYTMVEGKKDHPVVFGQLTKRDGSFLMGRAPEPDFSWDNLSGKTILMGRPGGMPDMTLRYVLNQKGYTHSANPTGDKQINMDTSINDFNALAGVFAANTKFDYGTMFEPTATEFQLEEKAYIVASVGQESGEVPFTSFIANPSYLKSHAEQAKKFLKAIKKAYDFIMTGDTKAVAQSLKKSFDGISAESCEFVVISYKNIDAWNSTPVLAEDAFNRMQDVIENAGNLKKADRVDFAKAVDNTYAKAI